MIITAVPVHKSAHADVQRRTRLEAKVLNQIFNVGIGGQNVAWLHRGQLFLGGSSHELLEYLNEPDDRDRVMIADIVEAIWRGTLSGYRSVFWRNGTRVGRFAPYANHPFDDVIEVGEIPPHVTIVEQGNFFPRQNIACKRDQRHVGRPQGP